MFCKRIEANDVVESEELNKQNQDIQIPKLSKEHDTIKKSHSVCQKHYNDTNNCKDLKMSPNTTIYCALTKDSNFKLSNNNPEIKINWKDSKNKPESSIKPTKIQISTLI